MTTTKRDYYGILGVQKDASEQEIKRAYRSLAMKHHPDRVPEDKKKNAEEQFKEISEAYAVLSDSEKRRVYDQYGHAGFDQRYSTEDIFRGADFGSIFDDLGLGGSIFDALFGGGGGDLFGRSRHGRGADLEMEIALTFEEAAHGVSKSVKMPRRELCEDCRGQGGKRGTCSTCKGAGQIRQQAGFMMIARPCHTCRGQGTTIRNVCKACRGEGRISRERKLEIKVPAGVESGMRLRLTGEGEGGLRSKGDLYVHLFVEAHAVFRRDGVNLLLDYPVNFAQASLGAEVELPTMNGRVTMKVPSGTQSTTVFRVRGKGLPELHGRGRGDLLVRVIVETPTNLSKTQRKFMEEFGETFGDKAHPQSRSFLDKAKSILKR